MNVSLTGKYFAEFLGTMILILFGDGVVANVVLNKTKGHNGGWIVITTGWAVGVGIPAFIFGNISGAHLNPALTIALAAFGKFPWADVPGYIVSQLLGGIAGGVLVWLLYFPHWAETDDKLGKLSIFCTTPAVRNIPANILTEVIATFILVFAVLGISSVKAVNGISPGVIFALIWGLGLSFGGPTGYAMNPARDLGPRIAHSILPIAGKGDSDWQYGLIVPIFGPIIGGLLGALVYQIFVSML
ncbi:MIP family channel protein [Thermoanaerobacterium xylanolyticum LX-11]|uniref:MIP family channel protein n=1 Tax=Thermoanaerobacterium xylanolyticum (strain ATCC 49914 / DSM 7097 / LX-11) TaxID=858215 RepID=F6BHF1_THEXL|nr:MIP/aquaporin family protein [Thermoanaerobacterium xylanolyticum]AEF16532.1 MIP family channel protein [Thermoanaerobacterium xylanolyticum LX-11]